MNNRKVPIILSNMLPLDHFDKIIGDANLSPIYPDETIGRNLYTLNENQEIILCHVPTFVGYTEYAEDTSYDCAVSAMLAMHHWNNGNGVIVEEIESINDTCPIRFTTEIFENTEASPAKAIRDLTNIISRSIGNDEEGDDHKGVGSRHLQPCAVLGTAFSSVSVQFATITGIHDLLQVSPSASSIDLENQREYPLFARTHPSDGGAGKKIVDYLHDELNVMKFVVVHSGDSFGNAYNQAVQSHAKVKGMNCLTVRMDPHSISEESVYRLLEPYSGNQINYFVGIFLPSAYEIVMKAAWRLKLVGPGKLWIHSGAIADMFYYGSQTYPRNSTLAKATIGNAILTDGGGVPGVKEYDTFQDIWTNLSLDKSAVQYFNSKQPLSEDGMYQFNRTQDYFSKKPASHFTLYAYEAIIGMGLSACRAAAGTENISPGFSGKQHHAEFLNINFKSASGDVRIAPGTISRDSTSTYYALVNILEVGRNTQSLTLQGVDHMYFDWENGWKKANTFDYTYSDGTTKQPLLTIEENMNLIPLWERIFVLTISSILVAMSIGFLMYTIMKRKHRAIKLAQPPFLWTICCGTLLLPIGIINFAMDEGLGLNEKSLNITCTTVPWFLSIGFVVTFSALFSKLWRLNKIIDASLAFRQSVKVSVADVLIPFIILFVSNMIVLIIWATVDPIRWEREVIETNAFNEIESSIGYCTSNHYSTFSIILAIVNGVSIILACHQAYNAKDVQTDFNESKNLGIALGFIFQSFFFGLPILVVTSRQTSSTRLYVTTSMVAVVSVATQLSTFLPIINKQKITDGFTKNTFYVGRTGWGSRLRILRDAQKAQRISLINRSPKATTDLGGAEVSGSAPSNESRAMSSPFVKTSMMDFDEGKESFLHPFTEVNGSTDNLTTAETSPVAKTSMGIDEGKVTFLHPLTVSDEE